MTRRQGREAAMAVSLFGLVLWVFGLLALLFGSGWGLWPLLVGLALCVLAVIILGAMDPPAKTYGETGTGSLFGVRTTPEEHFVIGEDGRLTPAPVDVPGMVVTRDSYAAYLQSAHWRTTRQRKLEAVGRRCQLCGDTHRIEIHHNRYDHLGAEPMDDLIALCHDCHQHFHAGRQVR